MLGMSGVELMIILALALILLGPDQLPSVAKTIGKGLREIRKATDDLKSTFEQEMVKMEDEAPVQPGQPRIVSPLPGDPASARANARSAALGPPAPPDPASARAAARLAAARGPTSPTAFLPAEGTVPREAAFAATPAQLTPPAAVSPAPVEPAPLPLPDEPGPKA